MEKKENIKSFRDSQAPMNNDNTSKYKKFPFYLPLKSESGIGKFYLEVTKKEGNQYLYSLINASEKTKTELSESNFLLGHTPDMNGLIDVECNLAKELENHQIKITSTELLKLDPVEYNPNNEIKKLKIPQNRSIELHGISGHFELDPESKQVYSLKKDKDTSEYKWQEPFLDVFPKKIVVKQSPLEENNRKTTYEMIFVSKRAKYPVITEGSHENILNSLKEQGYVLRSYNAGDKLSCLTSLMYDYGYVDTDYKIEETGFFWLDKKIVAANYDMTEPSETELFEALKELDKFSSYFGNESKDKDQRAKIATILKLGLTTPFNYVRKEMGYSEVIKPPMVYGKPGSGKTTIFLLIAYIFNMDIMDYEQAGSNVQRVARFAELMGKTTFPTLIDEAGNVFDNKALTEMNKTGLRRKFVRNKLTRDGRKIKEPAYSTFLYASNYNPIKDSQDGTARRYHIIPFEESEFKDENSVKVKEFNEEFRLREPESPLKKLEAIGRFTAEIVINNPKLLEKDPLVAGEAILEEIYRKAGRDLPYWIRWNAATETLEDIEEQEKGKIIGFIHSEMMQAYKSKIQVIDDEGRRYEDSLDDYNDNETIEAIKSRFYTVAKEGILSWIMYKEKMSSFVLKPNFRDELGNKTGLNLSIKSIAQKFEGWEYTNVKIGKEQRKMIKIPKEVFYDSLLS